MYEAPPRGSRSAITPIYAIARMPMGFDGRMGDRRGDSYRRKEAIMITLIAGGAPRRRRSALADVGYFSPSAERAINHE